MAISSANARNQIAAALASNRQRVKINKGSLSTQIAGAFASLWLATGQPTAGAAPTAAALCDKTTTGAALNFVNAAGGNALYLARRGVACANAGHTVETHDRIAHMGGLSGTVTTAQTVNLDPVALGAASDRTGSVASTTAYTDLTWFLEWYTATGSTAVTATITYTNAANTAGRTTTVAVPASTAASRAIPIIGNGGEAIKSIQSVTLSASTLTAGNFGVTCTRKLTDSCALVANTAPPQNWADLGLPLVGAGACLAYYVLCTTTTSGAVIGDEFLIEI